MVVINDEPMQELVFDHPDVRIINRTERIPSIAAKLNIGVSECIEDADLIFHTDDDDLFAPERIRVAVEHLSGGVFKTDRFYVDTDPPVMVSGRNIGNYAYTPRVWARYGGYRDDSDRPFCDINLINHFDFYMAYHGLRCRRPEQPFMLYRKHTGETNLSTIRDKVAQIRGRSGDGEDFIRGRIELSPVVCTDWRWRADVDSEALKVHLVDPAYSDVDLSRFYAGLEH